MRKSKRAVKLTPSILRRIIKEEKAKLQEAYEYNPLDEMYLMERILTPES